MQMRKSNLNIAQKTSFTYISKIGAILFLLVILLPSCDTCTGIDNVGEDPEEVVYFTAAPINDNQPNIYRTDASGSFIENIILNGVAFSSPAVNGSIAYIRKDDSDGNNMLYTSSKGGSNQKLILKDNELFNVSYPVISPDGRYLAFSAGNSRLFYIDNSAPTSVFNQISSRLTRGSVPEFSPNSQLLAFLEGDGATIPFTIKVIDAKSTDIVNVRFEKKLSNPVLTLGNEIRFSWSADSKQLVFTIRNATNDEIIILDVISGNERIINIPNAIIGGNQAQINPNGNFLAVSGTDGNIWMIFIATNDYRFSNISNSNGFERNHSPKWSPNGDKILYSSSSQLDSDIYSTLVCTELQYEVALVKASKTYILSNNAFRGFWNNQVIK